MPSSPTRPMPPMLVEAKVTPKKFNDLAKILPTPKQRKYFKGVLSGMKKGDAAEAAGLSRKSVGNIDRRIRNRLASNEAFIEVMQENGLTIENLVGELKRGALGAMHPQFPDQPDNFNRRFSLDMIFKLFGAYAPTKVDIDIEKREMKIDITDDVIARIEKATRGRVINAALE